MIDREAFKAALGVPDAGFDRALDAALRSIRAKEARPVMKKKLSVGLLIAITAIVMLTGAALAVGLNLFERFARRDERLAQVAPQAELATETPGEVETKQTGKSAVEIVNAYYDGESLIVAYTGGSARTFEPFTPTEEELAKMEVVDDDWEPYELGPLDPVQQAYIDAVRAGEPFGYAEYSVFVSDQWFAGPDGEIELVPRTGDMLHLKEGCTAYLVEFVTPLPEGVRNRDELELHLPIQRNESRVWFDGKNAYFLNGPLDSEARTYEWFDGNTYTSYGRCPERIGEAVATVKRSEAERQRLAGEGRFGGVPITVETQASPLHIALDIEARGEAFPELLPPDWEDRPDEAFPYYQFLLTDEAGNVLEIESGQIEPNAVRLDFRGNGHAPAQLRLYIAVGEEAWDEERFVEAVEPIVLTGVD